MARSRPFGLFILVSCLVACVCAHADVSREEAQKAAKEAQDSAKKVLKKVTDETRDATRSQSDVNIQKGNAEEAATKAEEAAKGNVKAGAVAEKAKNAAAEALKIYSDASELATKYLESMRELRTKAEELDKKAENDLDIISWGESNYTKIKEDADTIKAQVEALDKEFQNAMGSHGVVAKAQNEMLKPAKEAQLARYHVDAIVAVAKVETVLESAENDIKLTEQKRDEINATLQEMKKLYDNSPRNLIHYFSSLKSMVEGFFRSASYAVEEAMKAKEVILGRKKRVDDALVKVEAETDVDKAEKEVGIAQVAAQIAEGKLQATKDALESATRSAINALHQKEDAVKELNKNENKPVVSQDSDKTNPQDSATTQQPVKDTTQSPVVIGTKKPTITNPDQSISGQPVKDTTESPTVIGTKKPAVTNPDQSMSEQPMKDTTESPTVIGTKKPTITNPDQSGSGGAEPTQNASNDGAMTVSVPLLLALIACAALH